MDTNPMALARSRKRPRSRGSTTSIHSASTQPNLDHTYGEQLDSYQQGHWMANMPHGLSTIPQQQHNHSQPRELAPAPQLTPEDLLVASQYSMDVPVNGSMHGGPFPSSHHMNRQSMSHDSYAGNNGFADDSQLLDRDGMDDGDSFVGMQGGSKAGSRSSANNETEMRQLFTTNKHRHLQDVAEELHGNERGPNSERTRQIFAMLWINQVCSTGKGSVPRGRVYANYASRCAAERITVLNPASFGKLVRVLFPGLKTRRLGVRGESKYHYVNFSLTEEQPDVREQSVPLLGSLGENASFSTTFQSAPSASSTLRQVHSYGDDLDAVQPAAQEQQGRSHGFQRSLYNQPLVDNVDQLQSTTSKTALRLCFAPEQEQELGPSEPLVLPAISSFLPSGTDTDAAMSLTALYRSHCTSLVECIRYCKEKTFFHLFTSFQGTLTMPVQKLFGNPAIAAWIEECDFVLYQRMIRIISRLTLQVVPKPVLDTLRSISERLVPHIRESFQGQPQYVVRAKEAPATIFAALLDRVLRVNLTAHAAANMLANPANRDLMYIEWIQLISIRKLAEAIPTRGMDDLVNLLLTEMRDLLDPVDVPWETECMTLQGGMVSRNGRRAGTGNPADNLAINVLDRWVGFLRSLPQHFPYASHTDIVWCVEKVGTTVMRDLTITQGKSFGSWWVTKCWIDEMILFLAEQGGFMQQKISQCSNPPKRMVPQRNQGNASNRASQFSNAGEDVDSAHVSQSQPDRAQFPSERVVNNEYNSHSSANSAHDDSGIGIKTPDEDLPMEKFGFTPVNGQHSFAAAALQHHMAQI